jgi:radical SAM protein with 4Fe4S-binding SPASM domain
MTRYEFDNHKLFYHFETTYKLLSEKEVNPIYVEYSPVGSCNQRCIFCAYDYIGHKVRKLHTEKVVRSIKEFGEVGVKAILFAGEGEPLIHPDLAKFVQTAYENNVSCAIYTNGVLLNPTMCERILEKLTFIRVSFNGGTREVYKRVHGRDDFERVIRNIEYALNFREKMGINTDIGMQIVVIPENLCTIVELAKLGRSLGVDYLSVKPFVQHKEQKGYKFQNSFKLEELEEIFSLSESYSTETYKVVVRRETFRRATERSYNHCLALPIFGWILSDGNMYACNHFLYDERFFLGNIHKESVFEIITSERRKKVIQFAKTELDCRRECVPNCRLNTINISLWELKHPTIKHINFI